MAFKVLRVTSASAEEEDRFKRRFFREASILAHLQHPNIVTVFDYGAFSGAFGEQYYIAMEYLSGETLADRIARQKRLGVAETVSIGRQVARGLAEAHASGAIHRDLKPANVMLQRGRDGEDFAKIVRFRHREGRDGHVRPGRRAHRGGVVRRVAEAHGARAGRGALEDRRQGRCLLVRHPAVRVPHGHRPVRGGESSRHDADGAPHRARAADERARARRRDPRLARSARHALPREGARRTTADDGRGRQSPRERRGRAADGAVVRAGCCASSGFCATRRAGRLGLTARPARHHVGRDGNLRLRPDAARHAG